MVGDGEFAGERMTEAQAMFAIGVCVGLAFGAFAFLLAMAPWHRGLRIVPTDDRPVKVFIRAGGRWVRLKTEDDA